VVDVRPLPGQHPEADAARGEVMDRVHEGAQVAPEPVELPDDERVALAQRLETRREAGPIVASAGGGVFVDVLRLDPCGKQCVPLQVGDLASVRLADAY